MASNEKNRKVVAIIQARMGSTRLPGKVLKLILDRPMLFYIVNRIQLVKEIDEVVIATSENQNNDVIRDFCKKNQIECFSGSENDVLDRFYKAAKKYGADVVIRFTADCPLLDPGVIGNVLNKFLKTNQYDLLSVATGAGFANKDFKENRFPDGLDTEVFSFPVLEAAWKEAKDPLEREHVTPFIWKRSKRFRFGAYTGDKDYSMMRWTVDNQDDFDVVEAIYNELYPKKPDFGMQDVLDFFKRNPEILKKNMHFIGSEGYDQFWKDKKKLSNK